MAYSCEAVAESFLDLANETGRVITNLKMQKLVYFAHGYTLAWIDRPLIKNEINAWTFGPVIPDLYEQLRKYGRNPITSIRKEDEEEKVPKDSDEYKMISFVWNYYKDATAQQLSKISHLPNTPWDKIWSVNEFSIIPDITTKEYYLNLMKNGAAR